MPLGEESNGPHDVTACEGQDERAAPNRLILAFGGEKVGKKAGHNDEDESDDYACTIRHGGEQSRVVAQIDRRLDEDPPSQEPCLMGSEQY